MINELQNSLEHLRFFIPPTGIMVVGAGNGSGIRAMLGWDLDNVALIEADAAQSAKMERAFALPQTWRVFNTVVGSSDEEIAFYRASNPAHNGTLDPESLRVIWPNLCANDTEIVLPTRIDALVSDNGLSGINWLFIECFPVIDIARSAEKLLEGCEVVAVRTLDDACAEGTSSGNFDVEGWFGARGFRLARRIDTDHPSVFNLLFVRDFQQQTTALCSELQCRLSEAEATAQELEKSRQALEGELARTKEALKEQTHMLESRARQAEQKLAENENHVETLRGERDAAYRERDGHKSAAEQVLSHERNKIAELVKAKTVLEEKSLLLENSRQVLETELEASKRSANEWKNKSESSASFAAALENELTALRAEKEVLAGEKTELEANVNDLKDQLNGAKQERDSARAERDSARSERDALKPKVEALQKELELKTKQWIERGDQINTLQKDNYVLITENDKVQSRQKELEDQLLRAEMQIDVIKELLISEKQ